MSFAPVLVETAGPHAGATATIEIALEAAVVRVETWNRCCDATGAAGGEGRNVISVPAGVRILVATKPVDFRAAPTALRRWRRTSFDAIRSPGRSSSSARNGRTD
jgi:hypothetical protein